MCIFYVLGAFEAVKVHWSAGGELIVCGKESTISASFAPAVVGG